MADVTLGLKPQTLALLLTRGADFVSTVTRDDGEDWIGSLTLRFYTSGSITSEDEALAWEASIVENVQLWDVDEVAVEEVLDAGPRSVRMWYVEDGYDVLLASGEIEEVS